MFARARDDALDEDGFNAVRAFVDAYVELVDAGYDLGALSPTRRPRFSAFGDSLEL